MVRCWWWFWLIWLISGKIADKEREYVKAAGLKGATNGGIRWWQGLGQIREGDDGCVIVFSFSFLYLKEELITGNDILVILKNLTEKLNPSWGQGPPVLRPFNIGGASM
jgi:hypothetical protein